MNADRSIEFRIEVHPEERIVEVVYPSHPTFESFARYAEALRAQVKPLGEAWSCLVDQRAVTVIQPELAEGIAQLNAHCRALGLQRVARVLRDSAITELQVRRIFRESGMEQVGSIHHSREAAWRSLVRAGSPAEAIRRPA